MNANVRYIEETKAISDNDPPSRSMLPYLIWKSWHV